MLGSIEWTISKKDHEDWIFLQCNASCHKSREVMEFFEQNDIIVADHPPQSPDLNPIENIWNYVKRKIHENHSCSTADELWHAFEIEWEQIPRDFFQKLIISMVTRMKEVKKGKGFATKY